MLRREGLVTHSIDSFSLENSSSAVRICQGFYFVLIKHGCGHFYTNCSAHLPSEIKGMRSSLIGKAVVITRREKVTRDRESTNGS